MAQKQLSKGKEVDQTLTCKLRKFRFVRKLTQQQLAAHLKVTRQTILAIENNQYYPSLLLAFKIANYFHISLEQLFTFTEQNKAEHIDEALEFEQMVWDQLKKIHPEINWDEEARLKKQAFPNLE